MTAPQYNIGKNHATAAVTIYASVSSDQVPAGTNVDITELTRSIQSPLRHRPLSDPARALGVSARGRLPPVAVQEVVEGLPADADVHLGDGPEERVRVEVVGQAGEEAGQRDELHGAQLVLVQVQDAWPAGRRTAGRSAQGQGTDQAHYTAHHQ